jgi:hypothetical protein
MKNIINLFFVFIESLNLSISIASIAELTVERVGVLCDFMLRNLAPICHKMPVSN